MRRYLSGHAMVLTSSRLRIACTMVNSEERWLSKDAARQKQSGTMWYLEVATAYQKVYFLALLLLKLLQGCIDFVQLPMTAALHCNLHQQARSEPL